MKSQITEEEAFLLVALNYQFTYINPVYVGLEMGTLVPERLELRLASVARPP